MAGVASKQSKQKLPVYRHHKPSGQARVRWQGREIYLGTFESPESRQRYAELLTQIVTGAKLDIKDATRRKSEIRPDGDGLSINELCVLFLQHAEQHYRKNGKRTSEYDLMTLAIEPLKVLFGELQKQRAQLDDRQSAVVELAL